MNICVPHGTHGFFYMELYKNRV